jgi:hypothetical protein
MPSMKSVFAVVSYLALAPAAVHAQASEVEREFVQGDFTVSIARDAMTDENRSFILSVAESEEGGLGWRCLEDGLNVVLAIGTYYEGDDDDDIIVQYRFDSDEPEPQEYWALFSGKESAYIRMANVDAFTERALNAERVVVRAVDPYDDETHTYIVGLEDLQQALEFLPCAR